MLVEERNYESGILSKREQQFYRGYHNYNSYRQAQFSYTNFIRKSLIYASN